MSGIMIDCGDLGVWCDIDHMQEKVHLEITTPDDDKMVVMLSGGAARMLALHLDGYGQDLGGIDPMEEVRNG